MAYDDDDDKADVLGIIVFLLVLSAITGSVLWIISEITYW